LFISISDTTLVKHDTTLVKQTVQLNCLYCGEVLLRNCLLTYFQQNEEFLKVHSVKPRSSPLKLVGVLRLSSHRCIMNASTQSSVFSNKCVFFAERMANAVMFGNLICIMKQALCSAQGTFVLGNCPRHLKIKASGVDRLNASKTA